MRHVLLPGAPATGPYRMGQAPTAARLVTPTGGTLGVISGLLRTATCTIDLTAVAAGANKHLRSTTDTHTHATGPAPPLAQARPRMDDDRNAWNNAPACVLGNQVRHTPDRHPGSSRSSRNPPFSTVIKPAAAADPARTTHSQLDLHMRRCLTVALARSLERCPCCNAPRPPMNIRRDS
jgi:hypothetical protein